jgi:hypothetical protein
MKIDIKTTTLICLFLGSLLYLLSNKNKQIIQSQQSSAKDISILIIDKKSLPLPTPKPLYLPSAQKNYLEVGDSVNNR